MTAPLRVLMTATSFPQDSNDWRGRFIFDMAANLGAREDVELSLWAPPGELPPRVADAATASDAHLLAALNAEGGIAHLLRKRPARGAWRATQLLWRQRRAFHRARPDVCHVNWAQNALALGRSSTPALVTVLGMDFGLLRHAAVRTLVRGALRRRAAILCPNAEWMAGPLEDWFGDRCAVEPIPFGVQPQWFEVERRVVADPIQFLVVSRITAAKLGPLLDWGARVFPRLGELHLVGPMQEQIALPSWVRYHGPLGPAQLRSEWFPRVAGLVTLSAHDEGRPQVLIEAMAAGIPVIVSKLPAHVDLVESGRTGFVVDSPEAFGEALAHAADPALGRAIGERARVHVRTAIGTWADTAARYAAAYRRVAG